MIHFFTKLYKGGRAALLDDMEACLRENGRRFIVTANPEAFTHGKNDPHFASLLLDDATTVIADGIGIVKGAKHLGITVEERIPGVEFTEDLLALGNKLQKSVFFFGAKKETLDPLCRVVSEKYPNLTVSGAVDGYGEDKDAVFDEIKTKKPDIVLVALGVPVQERLIYKHLFDFEKGIFVGVGGSFDVLSGTKARAPKFFLDHNLEWLYRIAKEPKRLGRFYENNIKFFLNLKK